MNDPARKRPTLAVVLDNLFEGYEAQLWKHVSEAARAEDVNLLCFLAGPARGQRLQRVVFDLPSRETVDGIIGLFGTLNMGRDGYVPPATETIGRDANAAGCFADGELLAFARRFAPLPVVSIGKLVAGLPSVLVENQLGVEALVSHLVAVHARRRIAFIRGPDGNEEAEARLRGYRAALARHGLDFDPALVCPGDFTIHAGPQAVRALLDERRVRFDALAGANDLMAIHAMQELQRRGVRVPDDVAVVGYDDQPDAASVAPALTTVRQPLREMGITAVQQVLAMIRGGAAPATTLLPTHPVWRRSCGCTGSADGPARVPPRVDDAQARPRAAWIGAVAEALEAADPWLRALPAGCRAPDLAEALCAELEGAAAGFVEALDAAVSVALTAGVPPDRWRGFLLAAFDAARRRCAPDGTRLLALHSRAVALLGERAEHLQAARAYALEHEAFVLQHVFRVTGVEEQEFTAALGAQLPKLGVRSFFLARVVDPASRTAVLDYHYALDHGVVLDPAPGPYPAQRLLPGRFSEAARWTYVVMPLHFGAEVTGFAVCAGDAMSGSAYEALANQLGRAFKASTLVQDVRRYAAELEVRVEDRARQLKEAQEQLVEIAHEAGMAEIAVGALHNVGNLLTSISVSAEAVTAAAASDRTAQGLSRLVELLQAHRADLPGFFAADARAALVPEYGRELVRAMEADRDRLRAEARELQASVLLVRETIATLHEYARAGQDHLLVEPLDLAVLVDAALQLQATHLARHRVRIERRLAAVAPVHVQRFKLIHVLVNLVKNAVESMRGTREAHRILTVELSPRGGGGAILHVADTGEGIPPAELERLFQYGFTTKPDGHGFGLHACANYVHEMGGQIRAESDGPGRGSRFTVELPG